MIAVLAKHDATEAGQLVLAALQRSVSRSQANWIAPAELDTTPPDLLTTINPDSAMAAPLLHWLALGRKKMIIFGTLPEELASHLHIQPTSWPDQPTSWSRSQPAPTHSYAESPAEVCYTTIAKKLHAQNWRRPLERFDFTDEWNNLGYGAIRADASIWSLAAPLRVPPENELASLCVENHSFASYAGLFDQNGSSILWFNRPVGPIDSFEWRIVENFLSTYRHETLPCQPVISEIPWGYDAAVTMRLDCDEDIESARSLWQAYQEMKVPFSLAVHTTNLTETRQHTILRELIADKGCILSHTATHAPNWGGSYTAATEEAIHSAQALQTITGVPIHYAVSPFHQSPPYALAALTDAGYRGCIGGIIRNDPEFLLARGGSLANFPQGFIGHSQQCMLHGDCILGEGDPLRIYKQAFEQAMSTRTLFGYLDHPFSERYAYGWPNEVTRIEMHRRFIDYIRKRAQNPLFLTEEDAMNFMLAKASVNVALEDNSYTLSGRPARWEYAVEYRGECRPATAHFSLETERVS